MDMARKIPAQADTPGQVIDFASRAFPEPKPILTLLEEHIAKYPHRLISKPSIFVRSEWICCGYTAWTRAFHRCDDCDERTLFYQWYVWERYPTGEIRRVFRDELRICPTCGTIGDPYSFGPGDGDGGRIINILLGTTMAGSVTLGIIGWLLEW